METLLKNLADNDRNCRDESFEILKSKIAQQEFTDLEWFKIYKACFYYLWMADKMEYQVQISDEMAQFITKSENKIKTFSIFMKILSREWSGLDKYRLDKFYYWLKTTLLTFYKNYSSDNSVMQQHSHLLRDLIKGHWEAPMQLDQLKSLTMPIALVYFMADYSFQYLFELNANSDVVLEVMQPFMEFLIKIECKFKNEKMKSIWLEAVENIYKENEDSARLLVKKLLTQLTEQIEEKRVQKFAMSLIQKYPKWQLSKEFSIFITGKQPKSEVKTTKKLPRADKPIPKAITFNKVSKFKVFKKKQPPMEARPRKLKENTSLNEKEFIKTLLEKQPQKSALKQIKIK